MNYCNCKFLFLKKKLETTHYQCLFNYSNITGTLLNLLEVNLLSFLQYTAPCTLNDISKSGAAGPNTFHCFHVTTDGCLKVHQTMLRAMDSEFTV